MLKYLNVPQPWVSYYKPVTTILIIKFPNMETGSPSNASTGIWSVFYWKVGAGGGSNVGLVCCRLHLDLMLFQLLNEFYMKENTCLTLVAVGWKSALLLFQSVMFYDMGSGSTTATIVTYQTVKSKEFGTQPQLQIRGVGWVQAEGFPSLNCCKVTFLIRMTLVVVWATLTHKCLVCRLEGSAHLEVFCWFQFTWKRPLMYCYTVQFKKV